jgi:Glycoside hydrolase 123, catalytic domain
MKNTVFNLILPVLFLVVSCDDGGSSSKTEPVTLNPTEFTYKLQESTSFTIWTTPCTHKVLENERAPLETNSGLKLSGARNEFEPVQFIIDPGSGSFELSIDPFPNLGSEQKINLSVVSYENGWAEYLTPYVSGESVSLNSNYGVPVWITVYIPKTAPPGEHSTNLILTPNSGDSIVIPVNLYVFDFQIPDEINYASQLNVSVSQLIPPGGSVEDAKTMLFEHRFTPKSVSWPSGFNYNITWDNAQSTDQCEIFWDEPNEGDDYSIGVLSKKYILGEGWNSTGFPNSMLFQFVDNSTPRPSSFCGISRGDHYGTVEYNAEWSQWLGAMETWLTQNSMLNKGYYYVQNEPQNQDDHELAAHLCRIAKNAAPNLRIAISEEPKPEIAEDPGGNCGYDIWIAHIRSYEQDYAWDRQQNHGEEVWFYSLDHDPDPFFNPTLVEKQGIHQRIIPWVSWHYRATGWAYYDFNRFFSAHLPTIRAELFREGFEDYEYLYLANGGSHPSAGSTYGVDETVNSVASSLTSWNKNPDALMTLRHELGLYIEGTRATYPTLEIDSSVRPQGEYYINFQDKTGEPTMEPLVVDTKTYIKVGWQAYNETDNYGFYGEYIDNSSITVYGYDNVSGFSETEKSYIYDDYGRANLFEFALENGKYEITICVGRPQRAYESDPHNLTVEGVKVVDDEITTPENLIITRTVIVDLIDGSLSIEFGGRSESTGNFAYTFLSYMDIVPVL